MSLSKNIFKLLFVVAGGVTLYLGVNFFVDLHQYFQLSREVAAEFESWEIEEVSSSKFIIVATYHFTFDGATYHNRYTIKKPNYPNRYLAQDHLEKWQEFQKWVRFNPQNPHQSSLMRSFPLKKGIHLVLALGILLYFLWLNFYVKKMQS